jgi:hypothetical protein
VDVFETKALAINKRRCNFDDFRAALSGEVKLELSTWKERLITKIRSDERLQPVDESDSDSEDMFSL